MNTRPHSLLIGLITVALISFAAFACAMFAPEIIPQLATYPVARMIRNLERMARERPDDGAIQYELARIHVIAYAEKSNAVETDHPLVPDEAWISKKRYPDEEFPLNEVFKRKPINAAAEKESLSHLNKAVDCYSRAIELGTRQFYVYLGLGWCKQELGQLEEAKKGYRTAVEVAFEKEMQEQDRDPHGSHAYEAIEQLKKLLDKTRDAAELAKMENYDKRLSETESRGITPILLGAEKDEAFFDLIVPNSRVRFDLDGSGIPRRWGWISPKGAWLVFAPTQAPIESGTQLFGSVSFITFWKNGFDALAMFDDNGDGKISGEERDGLALWRDEDEDGRSYDAEVKSIADCGISSLSCRCQSDPTGMPVSHGGAVMEDGSTRTMYDWIIQKPGELQGDPGVSGQEKPTLAIESSKFSDLKRLSHIGAHFSAIEATWSDAKLDADFMRSLSAIKTLQKLTLGDPDCTHGADIQSLRNLKQLRSLDIYGGNFTGDRWPMGTAMPLLREALFRGTALTDKGLGRILDHRGLEKLDISFTTLVGYGLEELDSCPKLRSLNFSYSAASDEALKRIGYSRSLQRLSLRETRLTGECLDALSRLVNLKDLDLGQTRLEAKYVPCFSRFKHLEILNLEATDLDPVDLMPLAECPGLKDLITPDHIADSDLGELRRKLPDCLIKSHYLRERRFNSW